MLFLPAAAPVIAAAGPGAPFAAAGLGVAGLLSWLFGRGGNRTPAVQTPTNPVTGKLVPTNPDGSYWGIDPHNGMPSQLGDQLWNLPTPEGLNISGMTAEQYTTGGRFPFWINNRLADISTQLGGWDKMIDWLSDMGNWGTLLTVLTQPWGQGEYDKLPEGYSPEGQVTETPQGTPPNEPTTPEGQAAGDPTYTTTVTGQGTDPLTAFGIAIPGGLAALGALSGLGGMGGSAGTPTFSATGYGQMPTEPGGGAAATGAAPGQTPTFSVTGFGTAPQVPTTSSPNLGSLPQSFLPGGGGSGGGGGYNSNLGGILGGILGGAGAGILGGLLGGGGNSFLPGQQPGQQQQQNPQPSLAPIANIIAPSIPIPSAPYAQLPNQSPVASLFQGQPQQYHIPSLGQLLGGY